MCSPLLEDKMKKITLKNIDKTIAILKNKLPTLCSGKSENMIENMALNCFVIAGQFNITVEDYIEDLKTKEDYN